MHTTYGYVPVTCISQQARASKHAALVGKKDSIADYLPLWHGISEPPGL